MLTNLSAKSQLISMCRLCVSSNASYDHNFGGGEEGASPLQFDVVFDLADGMHEDSSSIWFIRREIWVSNG